MERMSPPAHPRDSFPSPLTRYLCTGVLKRMLGHREESGVPKGSFTLYHAGRRDADRRLSYQGRPKGNRTYVDAQTPRKSTNRGLTASSIRCNPRPR